MPTDQWSDAVSSVSGEHSAFGFLLRRWRRQRGMSQLDLALATGVSGRHLSFVETGRSRPKRALVLTLAEALDIPLRERNELLLAAGLPAAYFEFDYDSAELSVYRSAIAELIENHLPYPALVLNRWGDVVDANRTAFAMFPELVAEQPVNLYQAYLSSDHWKAVIENWSEVAWAAYGHLQGDAARYCGDERMQSLLRFIEDCLKDVPKPANLPSSPSIRTRLNLNGQVLETTTMVARFGPVNDVFLSELRVEMIFPANDNARRFFATF
ncbi:MAG: helix-turn-helix domain-containing protein [Pseudomonadales bacterium]|nr:helix-turn-helix domain-containing protein [Pseudomonadales bacterium]